jgi:preprotein translocase subunit SecY
VAILPEFLLVGFKVAPIPFIGESLDAVLPRFVTEGLNVQFYFGGTSLLIVVGVAMDTVQQIESQLIMRHYDGFMKKTHRDWRIVPYIATASTSSCWGAGAGARRRIGSPRPGIQISTGDILREAVQAGSELGRRALAILARGELVGDDVMIGIVRERLGRPDAARGFVLDGFPRTVAQAEALDALMAGRDALVVVDLAVADEELVRRRRPGGSAGVRSNAAARGNPAPMRRRCSVDDREAWCDGCASTRSTKPLLEFTGPAAFRSWMAPAARGGAALAATIDEAAGAGSGRPRRSGTVIAGGGGVRQDARGQPARRRAACRPSRRRDAGGHDRRSRRAR